METMGEEIFNKKPNKAEDVEKYTDINFDKDEFGRDIAKIKKDTGEIETNIIKDNPEEPETGMKAMSALEVIKRTNPEKYGIILEEAKKRVGQRKDLIMNEAEMIARQVKKIEKN